MPLLAHFSLVLPTSGIPNLELVFWPLPSVFCIITLSHTLCFRIVTWRNHFGWLHSLGPECLKPPRHVSNINANIISEMALRIIEVAAATIDGSAYMF